MLILDDRTNKQMNDSNWTWVLGGVGTIIATLAAAVASLFKLNESKNTKLIHKQDQTIKDLTKRAEQCESDRTQLNARVAVLEDRANED